MMTLRSALITIVLVLALGVAGAQAAEIRDFDAQRLWTLIEQGEQPVLLDVRSAEEFAVGHIPGAMNIPVRALPRRIEELRRHGDQQILVYCESGPRARFALWMMANSGFENLGWLHGHMQLWRQLGLPTERR